MTRIPYSIKCLKPNIFQMAVYLKQSQPQVHLHGRAFFALKTLLKEMAVGEWGMVKIFRSSKMLGCLILMLAESNSTEVDSLRIPRLMGSLTQTRDGGT